MSTISANVLFKLEAGTGTGGGANFICTQYPMNVGPRQLKGSHADVCQLTFYTAGSKVRSWLTAVVCRQPLSDRKINPDVYTTVLPPMKAKDPREGGN